MIDSHPVTSSFDEETGIGRLTFNRPQVLNAIDVPTAQSFLRGVRQLTDGRALRALVIGGAGRAFVAGGDLARFHADFDRAHEVVHELLDALHPAILTLREMDAPVISMVQGVVAGAGLSIVLAADFVVAAEDAQFIVAYDKVGAAPDCGGTYFLSRRVSRSHGLELMLRGDTLDVQAARAYGIVNEVVPREELEEHSEALARRIAAGPTSAYGAFKRLFDADLPLAQHLEAERAAFVAATRTADFREGVRAFLEKRSPVYVGK